MTTVSPTCNQAPSQICQVRSKVHPSKVERRSFFIASRCKHTNGLPWQRPKSTFHLPARRCLASSEVPVGLWLLSALQWCPCPVRFRADLFVGSVEGIRIRKDQCWVTREYSVVHVPEACDPSESPHGVTWVKTQPAVRRRCPS